MLGDLGAEVGIQARSQRAYFARVRNPAVVEGDAEVCAPLEALRVCEICRGGVLLGNRTKRVGTQVLEPVELQRAREDGVEAGDERTAAQGRLDQAAGSGACATGAD